VWSGDQGVSYGTPPAIQDTPRIPCMGTRAGVYRNGATRTARISTP